MSKFMKMLNNISRSQAIFRRERVAADDLPSAHYAMVLAICRMPGCAQEDIARELCLNKSTVARNLTALEKNGYITRTPLPADRRQFEVYPTEKMLSVLPAIQKASMEWAELLSKDIPQEQLDIFLSVLERMQERARRIVQKQEEVL